MHASCCTLKESEETKERRYFIETKKSRNISKQWGGKASTHRSKAIRKKCTPTPVLSHRQKKYCQNEELIKESNNNSDHIRRGRREGVQAKSKTTTKSLTASPNPRNLGKTSTGLGAILRKKGVTLSSNHLHNNKSKENKAQELTHQPTACFLENRRKKNA